MPATSGVSNEPGEIDTARMLHGARSRASGSVIAATPPFEAEQATPPAMPSVAAVEAVVTSTPRSPSRRRARTLHWRGTRSFHAAPSHRLLASSREGVERGAAARDEPSVAFELAADRSLRLP